MSMALADPIAAQIDESQIGAWYSYHWQLDRDGKRIGFSGDVNHRNWDTSRDLQQLLVRAGIVWTPRPGGAVYTFGYARSSAGDFGPGGQKIRENRIYQEASLRRTLGRKVQLNHRVRLEQRWIDGQNFRLRLRYALGIDYPINRDALVDGAVYLSIYDELFANLLRATAEDSQVERFDGNRAFAGIGYYISNDSRLELAYMHQQTPLYGKDQILLRLHHAF